MNPHFHRHYFIFNTLSQCSCYQHRQSGELNSKKALHPPKFLKISDQKNILEKFLKISENWLRFLEIAKKLPEVLSEENLQV